MQFNPLMGNGIKCTPYSPLCEKLGEGGWKSDIFSF